jgi:hypothetical protein
MDAFKQQVDAELEERRTNRDRDDIEKGKT